MFYLLLKPLMRFAIWMWFGKVHREGLEHIDNGRPSLIVANHTASFMDAMITAVYVKRRIWFFTRGDVFRFRWIAALMRSLGMLPVYRMRDGKDRLQENDASNDAALRILAKGGAVLIFAEGESAVDKVLKPLKKGPFRLAIRAAGPISPVIVPLGINYVLPSAPFGDAYLVAGAPYPVPEGDAESATRRATELMRRSATELAALSWHGSYPVLRPVAQFMLENIHEIAPDAVFETSLRLTSTFDQLNYRSMEALLRDWEEFRIWQRQAPLPRNLFLRPARVPEYLIAILGWPLAAAGWALHAIPLGFATYITRKRVKEPDFTAPVYLCLVVLLSMFWYGAMIAICCRAGAPEQLWIPLLLMPLSIVFLVKAWLPAVRHVTAPLARRIYRSRNPSARLVFRLYEVLMQIGWMMVGGGEARTKRSEVPS